MSVSNLIEKFRSVALDRIERMNVALVTLEKDGGNEELTQNLLREIHTLKGEAKMMGFADVNLVAHLTEHLMLDADVVDFDIPRGVVDLIFTGLDILRSLLTKSAGQSDTPVDLAGFVDATAAARFGGTDKPTTSGKKRRDSGEFRSVDLESAGTSTNLLRIQTGGSLRVDLSKLERLGETSGEMLLMTRRVDYRLKEIDELKDELDEALKRSSQNLPKSQTSQLRKLSHRLDSLLKEMREEVYLAGVRSSQVDEETRRLRHVPLAQVLSHYPRAVRDLALSQGKNVRLVHGFGDVQVDRVILTGLSDPLLHLVRNAVDHGIEPPEERKAVGKDEEGEIRLLAEYSGDSIIVELSDDGRGLDPDKLRARAIERGFKTETEADSMSDSEALQLIFESGFTTRDEVSDVSGRGIGMDIVRREVMNLNGSVEIESESGVGTTFRLIIPVSSAVSSVLMIVVGEQRFALPAKDIERVDVVARDELSPLSGGGFALRYGQQMVAMLDWSKLLGVHERPSPGAHLTLLILRRQARLVAVWVDDVIGEREAMTRPLGTFLSGNRICRGVALTDAGEVVPLLNVGELLNPTQHAEGASTQMTQGMAPGREQKRAARILVTEDSEITRSLVVGILRGLGYEVLEAEDGKAAWDRLQKENVDLVLTDVQMPHMDGLELLERIRASDRLSGLPVVVLTTLTAEKDRQRAMRLGANGYLGKLNFEEKELIRTVKRYLGS